jgi:hypothetical protein
MMGLTFPSTGYRRTGALPAHDPWDDLRDELDAWARLGRQATFWWRDDDAIAPTPALARLLDLARANSLAMALAVIPARAAPELFAYLASRPETAVIQHGYAHVNHAPKGAKKAELGAHRPPATVLAELASGRALLAEASGGRALGVVAPPWNRIDPAVAAGLASAGLDGLSAAKPRTTRRDAAGVLHANIHVDPIDWPGLRAGSDGFVGAKATLGAAIAHLRARRLGSVDADEPTGLLTHHLVMDETTWRFVGQFVAATGRHKAVRWLDPANVFDIAS